MASPAGATPAALITGASSGIGEAFARALPAADLLLTGRDAERLRAVADAARAANADRRVETLGADLATEAGRRAVIDAGTAFAPSLLINNAGLGQAGRVIDNPPERESAMAMVNVVAPVELTRALLPGMIERARATPQGRAGVILLASIAAFMPLPYLGTYAATKAFDLYYAEALAAELRDAPVDVLALCPGPTETRFFERAEMEPDLVSPAVSADRVAREGLRALGRETVHVVGARNRAMGLAPRLLPRGLVRGSAERMMRRFGRAEGGRG